ncbi:MAG: hypothetical protein IOB85_09240 [Methylobacterium sp.]|nr:hypothetical protein [Cupriavidus sp.]MCA3657038.1 hypothetical protein [Methylobacterium sp.]MCA3775191.1 hypothetical protein [Cutibacterium sp.]MCA3672594.1 hypothetical protein [Methylobacterium sp.]MCA3676683.1 hypothetical protein [Methylobacterium sp.]
MAALSTVFSKEAGMFAFSNEVPIDIEHTLDQLLARFSQLRDGLPELIKNSKDQYLRLGVSERSERQIVVAINTKRRMLAVLDFAGASKADFTHWKTWSGREGARQALADQIEAGHGNGGKAFMVRGASRSATMESCRDGFYTRMGYQNDDVGVRYRPGFGLEAGRPLDNVAENAPEERLEAFLKSMDLEFQRLPDLVKAAFTKRKSFTAVTIDQVQEWVNARQDGMATRVGRITDLIKDHGQTALTLETCDVWLLVDGQVATGSHLQVSELEPYPGFEAPLEFSIPDVLPDPSTKEPVIMSSEGQRPGTLRLETTKNNMALSDDLKARNVIRLWNARNNVANWPLPALGLAMPAVYFIRGRVDCPALTSEHQIGADRKDLADTPLVRALEAWVVEQVKSLAIEIQKVQASETAPQEQAKAKKALVAFRDLMRSFLEQRDADGSDADTGSGDKSGTKGPGQREPREKKEFGSRVDRIVLERDRLELSIATGTKVPMLFSCFEDHPDGSSRPVKADNLIGKTDTSAVVNFSPSELEGIAAGVTLAWLETSDGSVRSNDVLIEVLDVSEVDIVGPVEPLKQGEKFKLQTSFKTSSGSREDVLISASIDEPDMGSIGRGGVFTAGGHEGRATVRVKFGSKLTDQASIQIAVGAERVEPKGLGGESGSDIPEILLCGEEAPGMADKPADQRTHHGGQDYPTIIEEPQFDNIVWLNPHSAESQRVRKSMGTPKGLGGIGNKTFAQFMALKCFEVLKRLHVRQQIRDNAVTEAQFLQHAAHAEIECAGFIDHAWEASEEVFKKASVE